MSPTNRGYSPAAAPGRHNATTPHLCSQPSLFSSPFVLSLFMLFTLPLPPSEYTDSLCPQKEPDILVTPRENRGFQMQCLIHCCFRKPICPLPCPAFLLTLFLCHVLPVLLESQIKPFSLWLPPTFALLPLSLNLPAGGKCNPSPNLPLTLPFPPLPQTISFH